MVTLSAFPSLAAVLALVLAGCDDGPSPTFSSSDFPDEVGSRWTYAVHDSLTGASDTVEVEIIGERWVAIGDRDRWATVWRLTSPQPAVLRGGNYRYVFREDDTVHIWSGDDERAHYAEFVYVFPLEVGTTWTIPPCGQSQVVERRSLPLPGAPARTAFRVQATGGCLNDYFDFDRWFAPGVGLVEARFHMWGFASENQTWRLISFSLPDAP